MFTHVSSPELYPLPSKPNKEVSPPPPSHTHTHRNYVYGCVLARCRIIISTPCGRSLDATQGMHSWSTHRYKL